MGTRNRINLQIEKSTVPGSLLNSNSSNELEYVAPSTGIDHLWFYDDSATALVPLTLGAGLTIVGTTISSVSNASWKSPGVRAATTVAGTLASDFEDGDVIDSVTLVTGDDILIKNQVNKAQNGIYTVQASGAPVRRADADDWSELVTAAVLVAEGATNGNSGWICTANSGGTIDVTDNEWFKGFSTVGLVEGAGAANKVTYWSDPDTIASDDLFHFDPATDRLGVGLNTPTATLHLKGAGSTSATTSITAQDSSDVVTLNLTDDGQLYVAKSHSLSTNTAYASIKTGSAGAITITNTAGVSNTNIVGAFRSNITYAGANAFTIGRGLDLQVLGTNTHASNAYTGAYIESSLSAASALADSIVGIQTLATSGSANTGTISEVVGLKVRARNQTSGTTVTSLIGIRIEDLTSAGTTTDTYGLRIGDVTSGTQTNQAWAIYSSDTNSRSYLAGKIGIGELTPDAFLHLRAGQTTAGRALMKFNDGSLLTTPEIGAWEYVSPNLYFTAGDGIRRIINMSVSGSSGNIYTENGTIPASTTRTLTLGNSASVLDFRDSSNDLLFHMEEDIVTLAGGTILATTTTAQAGSASGVIAFNASSTAWNLISGNTTIVDNRAGANQKGLEYNADYSANFTVRSLVDKGYVDAALAGGGFGNILQNGNSFSAAVTLGSNDAFDFNLETSGTTRMTITGTTNPGRVGIGLTTPTAKLNVKGEGITSSTSGAIIQDSANVVYFNALDNGRIYGGKDFSILSNSTYSIFSTGNLGTGVVTLTNGAGVNITNMVAAFRAQPTFAGTNAFTQAHGADIRAYNTNTSTSNTITGLNLEARNTTTSARAGTITGAYINADTGSATGGSPSFVYPLFIAGGVGSAGITLNSLSMVHVQANNNQGTITQAHGLYIESQSQGSGTYTNVPYGILQEGLDDRNFFGARSGFGFADYTILSASAKIHIGDSDGTAGTAPMKFEPGTLLGTEEPNALEWDGDDLYITTNAGVRRTIFTTIGSGGASYAYTIINTTGPTYNATQTSGHIVILADATSNAITINLPTAIGNTAQFTVKKIDSSANAVTIDPFGAQTVDGSATAPILLENISLTLVNNNANWFVI